MATVEPYETKSGRRYMVRYRDPDRKQRKKKGFTRKRDAELYAATVEVDKVTGGYVNPTAGRVTIADLAEPWQASLVDVSDSWRNRLESLWRVHVEPKWGRRYVNQIDAADIQDWIAELVADDHTPRPLAPKTVRHTLGILAGILDRAVAERRLVSNPARAGIRVPRSPAEDRPHLTPEQLHALADEMPAQYRTVLWLLGTSGMRWGEMAALRPRDLKGDGRIRLARSYSKSDSRSTLTDLKGHELRTIVVPPRVEAMIQTVAEDRPRDGLIWEAPRKGGPLRPPESGHWLDTAVKRCHAADPEFPEYLNAHGLRHTAAAIMISSGAHVKTVQRQLGHKSAAMTLDQYGHLFDDDLDTVAEGRGRLLFPEDSALNVPPEDKAEDEAA